MLYYKEGGGSLMAERDIFHKFLATHHNASKAILSIIKLLYFFPLWPATTPIQASIEIFLRSIHILKFKIKNILDKPKIILKL